MDDYLCELVLCWLVEGRTPVGNWIFVVVVVAVVSPLVVLAYAVVNERLFRLEQALDEVSRWRGQLPDQLTKIAPIPLQKVYHFGLYVGKHFWTDTLRVTPEELNALETRGAPMGDQTAEDWARYPVGHLRLKVQSWFGGFDCIEVDVSDATRGRLGPTTKWTEEQNPCGSEITESFTELMSYRLTQDGDEMQLLLFGHKLLWGTNIDQWVEGPETRFQDDVYLMISFDDDLSQYAWPDDGHCTGPRRPFRNTRSSRRYRHFDPEVGLGWTLYIEDLQAFATPK
ncbi:MAG: hypothetical protein LLG20_17065 [Acidobacteriales bacterium]|nr:hypothetical protein [Terriglobales bacterium]